jgi:hypothetical protein
MIHATNLKALTLRDVFDWLYSGLNTFDIEPAGTDFEEGYQAALKDMARDLVGGIHQPLH